MRSPSDGTIVGFGGLFKSQKAVWCVRKCVSLEAFGRYSARQRLNEMKSLDAPSNLHLPL